MKKYDDTTYGQRIADVYDEFYADYDSAAIKLLAEFASDGLALELGIGTGRIALPLREQGVSVQGIDASAAMLSELRAKPHGTEIEVLTGSFANFKIDKRFSLVYVVFNTFFALLTQQQQLQCFKCVRDHLSPNGVFLLELFVPNLCRFTDNQTVRAVNLSDNLVRLEVSQLDSAAQQVTTQHVLISNGETQLFPVKIRYAWPSELDLMAQLAGLSLRHRWGSWSKDAFTKESKQHISVYELAGS